ncbi:RidA family protein [Caballeronia sp. J97]|uniref:RidA family protein n=1 Tax=Caballeronia sp. J97 TaxID=2805429 RepID=UPI002AB30390|nr:RidA family protein [Caballeronia sp. J97]
MTVSDRDASGARRVVPVRTGLPQRAEALFSWAVAANGTLYTAQIPVGADGELVSGGIEAQVEQVFANLFTTLEAAGATAADVAQVLIYVTDRAWLPFVNAVWLRRFSAPFPNRASVVVAGLAREEMLVEIVAYACPANKG